MPGRQTKMTDYYKRKTTYGANQRKLSEFFPKKSAYKRPSRFPSKKTVAKNVTAQTVAKIINTVGESKIVPLETLKDVKPVSINGTISGNRVTSAAFCLDKTPSQWVGASGQWNDCGGFVMPKGDESYQRQGNYTFLKKSTAKVNIKMKPLESGDFNGPVKFRVLHIVEKRRSAPSGLTDNPNTSLFMNTAGQSFGTWSTNNIDGSDVWQSMTNKRDWTILSDQKFTLQAPSMYTVPGTDQRVAQITKYPAERNMNWVVNFNKKVHYGVGDRPDDLNYKHALIIYAMYAGQPNNGTNICNNWVVDLRGSVSANDS